ncbi:Hypothetical predicted protein [Olea europaea subsp. europaea]|uniref:Uncharacterized protein n=1 Tax=Olea europaea subsp. europaea TaxID=158383 RepID=A0A8S0RWA7_OLEEU|nr:Hypothetical predicted protein [Olea europaea subsp. europaea]
MCKNSYDLNCSYAVVDVNNNGNGFGKKTWDGLQSLSLWTTFDSSIICRTPELSQSGGNTDQGKSLAMRSLRLLGRSIWAFGNGFVLGIRDLSLTELNYWPPHDRDINQRRLSLPAAILLQECFTLRKLFIHGMAREHFMMSDLGSFLLPRIPGLRDVQLREDYYPAPE